MIRGRGLLANALLDIDEEKYLFYANGISNSVLSQIPRNNFEITEIEEMAGKIENRAFIYFSTSQVNSELNWHRPYVKHKLYIERLIPNLFSNYLIVRTSNLVGNNPWNTHTLFNYLCNALDSDVEITVDFEVIRNFLGAEHFTTLLQIYLSNYELNSTIEIVNPVSYSMQHIIHAFEKFFLKKFTLRESTAANDFAHFELNKELTEKLMKIGGLNFEDHIENLLRKYYSHDKWIARLKEGVNHEL